MTPPAPWPTQADLGGRPGSARVQPEPEGEPFHADWEARTLALTLAMGATGAWNIDMSRAARETLPDYPRLSYYQIWLAALGKLLADRGLATTDECAAGHARVPPVALKTRLAAADVAAALARGTPVERAPERPARFALGDAVRTRAARVPHHTRLPGYAAGKRGRIERVHGVHVFADTHAQGLGEQPQWLYTVVFDGTELWGGDATPGSTVSIDAWEPYLERA